MSVLGLVLLLALSVLSALSASAPAQAAFDGYEWESTRVYDPGAGNFAGTDVALVPLPDGSFVELHITQEANPSLPTRVIAWAGDGDTWGAMEFVDGAGDPGTPLELDAFVTPDGSVVAVWLVSENEQAVYRTSTRAPTGGWSAPVDLFVGTVGPLRRVFPTPTGGTLLWEDEATDRLNARTWEAGAWGTAVEGPGGADVLPVYRDFYGAAVRPSDGQISITYQVGTALRLTQFTPGEGWETVTTHEIATNCEVDVGVLDQYGNIAAVVTLCYLNEVLGSSGAAYDPDGDLHLWWNGRYGMTRVEGTYPNHQIVCDCTIGLRGMVVEDGDLEGRGFETVVPGTPQLPSGRSVHQVWDADGDRTVFIGGQGYAGRTINYYREGRTFADPNGSFEAPGSPQSSRSGSVSATFVSGDDILVGYQHSAPAGNLGPGGSCNTRLLRGDGVLSDFFNICFDGNTDDWSAFQEPDGSVYLGRSNGRYVDFQRWGQGGVVPPAPATLTATWPSFKYGLARTVPVAVSVGGAPASGTVRIRYGATVLVTQTLSAGGTASLPVSATALTPGSRLLTIDYLGNSTTLPATITRTASVAKAAPKVPVLAVTRKPTRRRTGTAVVRVIAPTSGLATPTGTVIVVLKNGSSTKQVARTLVGGRASFVLPRLTKGTWRVSASYRGDARYLPRVSASVAVSVTR